MKSIHPGMTEAEIKEAEDELRKYLNLPEKKDLVSFTHQGKTSEQFQYKREVEKFIDANINRLIETFDRRLGPAEFIRNGGKLLGITEKVYEVKPRGALIYSEAHLINGYFASIELFGFDKEDELLRIFKSQLEELSKKGESFQ